MIQVKLSINTHLAERLVESAQITDDADKVDSFEEDDGHTQDPEGDGRAQRHDHPAEAGDDQTLDGVAVGDRHEDSQRGQHGGPD